MPMYCILEIEDGWTIVKHPQETTAEESEPIPAPYDSYEDACDALEALQGELEEGDASDVPDHRLSMGVTNWKNERAALSACCSFSPAAERCKLRSMHDPASHPAPVFCVRDVTKTYHMGEVDVVALQGVDFDLFPGEFVVSVR